MGRLREFESVVAFLSEEEIDEMQAAIDARRGARTGGGTLEAHEALSGTAVRVGEGARGSELAGMVGVIERGFGSPEHPALDVRLEDGRRELFCYHQLEKVGEAGQA
jgi:hypothetical protein